MKVVIVWSKLEGDNVEPKVYGPFQNSLQIRTWLDSWLDKPEAEKAGYIVPHDDPNQFDAVVTFDVLSIWKE